MGRGDGEDVVTTNWNFQQLLDGQHPELTITMEDWEDHLGMLFPDIRIKNILELSENQFQKILKKITTR